ncbi:type II toxin-antitoxin system antitoxin SocA domain-containing protein [Roseivirga pacifica]|uniref:type II toxin-antitoxin system antitoxin SocA domain-containing protein n=1 Tax=Roseivirga pacifica TaxID=1267423 RepID=UPI003BAE464B
MREIAFRKEKFNIHFQFYLCEDSGETFTTTQLDEFNMLMVEHAYRTKHHIPQRDEISKTREQYELSAVRMGEILGFGQNTYGLYEKGDLPSLANANLIKLASDPKKFKTLVEDWDPKSIKSKEELIKKIDRLINKQKLQLINFDDYLMGEDEANEFTGFKKPDLERLTEMIVFFAHYMPSFKTKMNKLLFYADFGMFKNSGQSISGAMYKAIPYGPVPNQFETLYERLSTEDVIDNFYEDLENGGQSEFLKGRKDRPFNKALFSDDELMMLSLVCRKFERTNASQIVEISHDEEAWIKNVQERSYIDYRYALKLKAI